MSQMGLFADGRSPVKPVPVVRGATISPCGVYRYRLWRTWVSEAGRVCWIMLNPSTADAVWDDPTVRRCMGFAEDWGYGGIEVVNLFAFRSTSPFELYGQADPVGPDNNAEILTRAQSAPRVIAAWGHHGDLLGRASQVTRWLCEHGVALDCLGLTKDGHPKHPVRLAGDTALVPYEARA